MTASPGGSPFSSGSKSPRKKAQEQTAFDEAFEVFRLISQDAGLVPFASPAVDRIDPHKLEVCMRSVGLAATEEQAKNMIKQLDTTGKGAVTFEEFVEMMKEKTVRFPCERYSHRRISATRPRGRSER